MDEKIKALAQYLECDIDELTEETYDYYGLSVISFGHEEYAIGTDDEAQLAVEQNIREYVWAFDPDWIVSHLNTDFPVEAIKAIQEKYEDGNDSLVTIVEKLGDWDYFVKDSIMADGRGHFLSSYDGEENEVEYEGTMYYIYQVN